MVTGAPKKIRGGFLLRLHGNADRSCGFAFDADTGKVIADLTRADVIAELEAMAIGLSGARLFVNMKTLKQIGNIDRNKKSFQRHLRIRIQ